MESWNVTSSHVRSAEVIVTWFWISRIHSSHGICCMEIKQPFCSHCVHLLAVPYIQITYNLLLNSVIYYISIILFMTS